MSAETLRVTTDADRARLYEAKRRADLCASCGRALDVAETVYVEAFSISEQRTRTDQQVVVHASTVGAPFGIECVSPEFLRQIGGQEPEQCAGCDRSVYYRESNPRRRMAACSGRCTGRAAQAKRQKVQEA